jgi:hypothetical protein
MKNLWLHTSQNVPSSDIYGYLVNFRESKDISPHNDIIEGVIEDYDVVAHEMHKRNGEDMFNRSYGTWEDTKLISRPVVQGSVLDNGGEKLGSFFKAMDILGPWKQMDKLKRIIHIKDNSRLNLALLIAMQLYVYHIRDPRLLIVDVELWMYRYLVTHEGSAQRYSSNRERVRDIVYATIVKRIKDRLPEGDATPCSYTKNGEVHLGMLYRLDGTDVLMFANSDANTIDVFDSRFLGRVNAQHVTFFAQMVRDTTHGYEEQFLDEVKKRIDTI